MKLYVNILILWIALIAIGIYLTQAELSVEFPLFIIGQILIIIGIIVAIIWAVKFASQFIPAEHR